MNIIISINITYKRDSKHLHNFNIFDGKIFNGGIYELKRKFRKPLKAYPKMLKLKVLRCPRDNYKIFLISPYRLLKNLCADSVQPAINRVKPII